MTTDRAVEIMARGIYPKAYAGNTALHRWLRRQAEADARKALAAARAEGWWLTQEPERPPAPPLNTGVRPHAHARPQGCICPPGAEQGCRGWSCPRRAPFRPAMGGAVVVR